MVRQVFVFGTVCMSAALLAAVPESVYAQRNALRGTVLDTTGAPLQRVDVGVAAAKQLVQTDENGRFYVSRIPDGDVEVMVRRLGYEPQTMHMLFSADRTDSVTVVLMPQVAILSGIEVTADQRRLREGIEDFYRRRARGVGNYVTREQIVARNSFAPSDVLRGMPGIRFVRVRNGRGVRFNFTTHMDAKRDCMPMLWIDGQRAPEMEVDDLPLTDIEGIELYSGPATTPMQFSQSAATMTCGTIVVWSRPPMARKP
jgi:carboxypeptidase family protein/TonB-dependent receptor-like protein